jgi:alpha-glucuronidase
MDVIILDSISHEWDGDGGVLDIHAQMAGNSFTNWSKITPRHNALVQKILSSGSHIISTIRSKQDYVITEKNGKSVPEKVGMKGVQRDGLEYDYTIVFELDIYNNVNCTKDRTQLFNSRIAFKIDDTTGKKIMQWCKDGEGYHTQELEDMIRSCKTIEELNNLYKNQPHVRKLSAELNHRAAVIKGQVPEYEHLKNLNGHAV